MKTKNSHINESFCVKTRLIYLRFKQLRVLIHIRTKRLMVNRFSCGQESRNTGGPIIDSSATRLLSCLSAARAALCARQIPVRVRRDISAGSDRMPRTDGKTKKESEAVRLETGLRTRG